MRLVALLLLLVCAAPATAGSAAFATPPGQPEAGPGSSDYTYQRVRVSSYGQGAEGYFLFEPENPGEDAKPVVLFLHGFNATDYRGYWLWIRHLVRRGNVVIYPVYQDGGLVDPRTFTDAAGSAAAEALARFDGDRHALADPERLAIVGHSLGGTIGANLAARADDFGLPDAGALMLLQPGDVRTRTGAGALLPTLVEDHATIPSGTLMLIVSVEVDTIVDAQVAEQIYTAATEVDEADKDLLMMRDDTHGRPTLRASHFLPDAVLEADGTERVNAYDFALWRWFDALSDAAFYDGRHREIALGNTRQQMDLGAWSDGTPVRPPLFVEPE